MKYCEACKTEDELIAALKKQMTDLVIFFEAACDDEEWGGAHPYVMRTLLRWMTRQLALYKLPPLYAEKAARAVQRHESMLDRHLLFRSVLFYNVNVVIQNESFWINSLMLAAGSAYLREQLHNLCWDRLQDRLILSDAVAAHFPVIKEYLYTGIAKDIWKREFKEVHEIMHQAYRWHLKGLVWQCVDVLTRYLDRENVIEHMLQAHRDNFAEWKHACYQFFNKQQWGLYFLEKGNEHFAVEFLDFNSETIELFNLFSPLVTHIAFRGVLNERPVFNSIVNRCPNLIGLDISAFKTFSEYLAQIPPGVLELIPANIEEKLEELAMAEMPAYVTDFLPNGILELDMSSCDWLESRYLKFIFMFCPQLKKLNLSGNMQLTYEAWAHLNRLKRLLSLDLSHCRQLTDEDLRIIVEACPMLEDISLADCPNLTDRGFMSIPDCCKSLLRLNLNQTAVTNKTLIDLANRASDLTYLSIKSSEEVTEKGIAALARGCPRLKFINVEGCRFLTETTMAKLQHARPLIQIIR